MIGFFFFSPNKNNEINCSVIFAVKVGPVKSFKAADKLVCSVADIGEGGTVCNIWTFHGVKE